jgi:hypothetical protein
MGKKTVRLYLPTELRLELKTYANKKGMPLNKYIIAILTKTFEKYRGVDDFWKKIEARATSRLVEVIPIDNFTLQDRFDNGLSGNYDMMPIIQQEGAFLPLADSGQFILACVNEDGKMLSWPGEIGLTSEAIYIALFHLNDAWSEL